MRYEFMVIKKALEELKGFENLKENPKVEKLIKMNFGRVEESICQDIQSQFSKRKNLGVVLMALQEGLGLDLVDENERFALAMNWNDLYGSTYDQLEDIIIMLVKKWKSKITTIEDGEDYHIVGLLQMNPELDYRDIVLEYNKNLENYIIDAINEVL